MASITKSVSSASAAQTASAASGVSSELQGLIKRVKDIVRECSIQPKELKNYDLDGVTDADKLLTISGEIKELIVGREIDLPEFNYLTEMGNICMDIAAFGNKTEKN